MKIINQGITSDIPKIPLFFLLHFIKKFKVGFVALILTAIIYAACQVTIPYIFKLIINFSAGLPAQAVRTKFYIILLCVLWVTAQVTINAQGWLVAKVMPAFKGTIKHALFNLIVRYPFVWVEFNRESTDRIIHDLANSSERVMQLSIFNFFSVLIALVMALVMVYLIYPIFAVLMLSWYFLHIFIAHWFIKKGIPYESSYTHSIHASSSLVNDVLNNLLNVKIFKKLNAEIYTVLESHTQEAKEYRKVIAHFEKMKLWHSVLMVAFSVSMISILLFYLNKNAISIGDFAMICMLSLSITNFTWQMSNQFTACAREYGAIRTNLNLVILDYNRNTEATENVNHHYIEFRNVSFSYANHLPIIKDLSLLIHPLDKIGIIGQSGLGKTTLINLLLGLHKINAGEILIGGVNLELIELDSLYEKITVIQQDIKLLNRSILENIQYGNSAATLEEVYQAAKMACCDEFIQNLPEGYATIIGENGFKLSGGQRQRIAFARMILKDSPIIIMDEPSSALDLPTENRLCQSLASFLKFKTLIIISHKSLMLDFAETIYQLVDGGLIFLGKQNSIGLTQNA